ncbi:MAG: hypothetical protein J0L81_17335 [Caulobacterales bacterium]|nr:hypothetical protein [Caulobacterales bacterium]
MKRFRLIATALAAQACFATAALAQETTTGDDIVVTGARLEEIVREFVGEVAAAPGSEDQIARWDGRICPGIIGLQDRAAAQAIIDRIAQRAYEVDLDVARPGCRADVIVFITPDSQALAAELRATFRQMMNVYSTNNVHTLGLEAMDDFVATPRIVRWWHVTNTTSADGFELGEAAQQVRSSGSRLSRGTRQDFSRVIIVVDATRAAGVNRDSLADYIAMVALAQLDLTADTSAYPSILNLFGEGQRPTTLTEWDRAYLTSLYGARRNSYSSGAQERDISREMVDQLTPPAAAPERQ